MKKDIEIILPDNEKIKLTTYGKNPDNYSNHLIYVHGFKGFKDWGFIPYMGEYFEKLGIFVITFNFSLNGIGEEPTEFTEIDKFSKNTFSREVYELNFILEKYQAGLFGNSIKNKLSILGHSRGGSIATFCGSNPIVNKVVLWASIAKLDRYTERQKEIWKKEGFVEIVNTRTNQVMRLDVSLLHDIESNKDDRLSIEKAIKNLNKPLLIAHGTNDLTVPIEEGYQLLDWSNKELTNFIKVEKGSHTFDITHPFMGSNEKFEFLLKETYNFITK
ncbi:MAG TPA: alpha/beta hydrolase [Melioribacteraceae bacterium]|nr:alpha/beta hydrolase [Melioribacteraceae bacterium]